MSQYRHLPIYKAAYDLLQAVTRATAGFPRAWKYSYEKYFKDDLAMQTHSKSRVGLQWFYTQPVMVMQFRDI